MKAIIFDMDGVLIDSEPLHLEAANAVLAREGASLDADQNRPYLGTNEREYWTSLVARFGLAREPAYYIAERHLEIVALLRSSLPIAPGLVAVLDAFRTRDIPMAVASSSERELVDYVLREGGIAGYFSAVATGDEVEKPKPDPEIFTLAARRLGVAPERCLVFEDSRNGVRAALAAGMTCIRVVTETTRSLEFPEVEQSVDSFIGLDVDRILGSLDARTKGTES